MLCKSEIAPTVYCRNFNFEMLIFIFHDKSLTLLYICYNFSKSKYVKQELKADEEIRITRLFSN